MPEKVNLYVCVCVALVIQHAESMRRVMLSTETFLSPLYFSTLSHKGHDFQKKVLNMKSIFILYVNFVRNISHSKQKSAKYCHKCKKSVHKVSIIFVRFQWKFNFIDRFSKKKIKYRIKILTVEAELFRVDRRTDTTKLIVAFRDFAKASEMI
jgi:hypothetical protein